MAKSPTTPGPATARRSSLLDLGISSVRLGELDLGERYLEEAVRREPRNAAAHFALAEVYDGRGKVGDAICAYADLLALKRDHAEGAQRLALLVRQYRLDDPSEVNPAGLAAALDLPHLDHQPVADLALAQLAARPAIAAGLAGAATRSPAATAAWLRGRGVLTELADEAALCALAKGINTTPAVERLLTSLRKALLLAVKPEAFADRTITALALAIAAQARLNGYVWTVDDEERAALDARPVDADRALSGDVAHGLDVLVHLLYAPAEAVLGAHATSRAAQGLKPHALRDHVTALLAEREEEAAIAAAIPREGAIAAGTSAAVKAQYEAHPYPRWTSLPLPQAVSARRSLARYFPPNRVAFLERPCDVLVAGAGTGRQAVATAAAFAPHGRVVAADLSRASLAYGARMARRLGITSLSFVEADLTDPAAVRGPFDVIECVGVLHHMADPFAGWQRLAERLAPGGIMLVGLYSAISRRNIAALRQSPEAPRPDCDDDAARAFRQSLLAAPPESPAAALARSIDFHSLPGFRDLVLNVCETPTTLPEIAAFLEREGLEFRGFVLPPDRLDAFAAARPGETWPGRLATWAAHEERNPTLFDGMYVMWVQRAPA